MNRASFLDELLKLASGRIEKRADDINQTAIPEGLIGSGTVPDSIKVRPDDAKTRRPLTAHLPSAISPGSLGSVTQAKDPIDRFKYNRTYRDRR